MPRVSLGDPSKLMALQVGLSPGEQLIVPGGGSRLSRSECNCQELTGLWLAASCPSVSSHWHPEGGRGLVPAVLPMPSAGPWEFSTCLGRSGQRRRSRPGFVCPRALADSDWGSADHKTAQCTRSTCGGGEVLAPGSHPPPSAAFGANPGFPGDTEQVSPRSSYKELMTSVSRQHAHGQSITRSALALSFHYYFMFGYQGGEAGSQLCCPADLK